MYVKHLNLYDGDDFSLTRGGNGLWYELVNKADRQFIYLHGDDALVFESEIEFYSEAEDSSYSNICRRLWNDSEYALVAEPLKCE